MTVAKVGMRVRRPVQDVYESIVDPSVTTRFWFSKSSGRLEPGAHVTWTWEMYGAGAEVDVVEFVPDERIVVMWSGYGSPDRVEWTFADRGDGTTYVEIENSGFGGSPDEVVTKALDSTQGFTFLLAGMKAWLEHGIELNLVPDAHPDALVS